MTIPAPRGGRLPSGGAPIAPGEYLDFVAKEYLAGYVSRGGSTVKVLVVGDESVARELADGLASVGDGFAHVALDAASTKVHMVDQVFTAVAAQLDWDALAAAMVRQAYRRADLPAPGTGRDDLTVAQVAAHHELDAGEVYRSVRRALEVAVLGDTSLSHEFRVAMLRLCSALLDRGDVDATERATVLGWLRGEKLPAAALRRAGLFARVARHNARPLLVSTTRWVRRAGLPGIVLTVDLERLLVARRPAGRAARRHLLLEGGRARRVRGAPPADRCDRRAGGAVRGRAAPARAGHRRSTRAARLHRAAAAGGRRGARPATAQPVRCAGAHRRAAGGGPMTVTTVDVDVARRRAIEALRAGVPSRDAVAALGTGQAAIEDRVAALLADAQEGRAGGVLLGGGFGAGKSHLLEHLGRLALDQGFVVSRVVISKETPLHDPVKVFQAAAASAVKAGYGGPAIAEAAAEVDLDARGYAELRLWAGSPAASLNERFPATLTLFARHRDRDGEFADAIVRFWSGDPIAVPELRRRMREIGEPRVVLPPVSARELGGQRLRFAAKLLEAAGCAGWLILFDEVELIGRYSLQQRAKSYAELARWVRGEHGAPGLPLAAVLAMTDDFEAAVITGKGDREQVGQKLRAKETAGGRRPRQRRRAGHADHRPGDDAARSARRRRARPGVRPAEAAARGRLRLDTAGRGRPGAARRHADAPVRSSLDQRVGPGPPRLGISTGDGDPRRRLGLPRGHGARGARGHRRRALARCVRGTADPVIHRSATATCAVGARHRRSWRIQRHRAD